ncbi:AraC family transcriptional regulator [Kaistia sp. 32K]|uniref:AraC family transcriptional regulator n=1 Tax=Kaistia sp. 32K TaxID=2795690 RepID=UPI0019159305|nr:helix-turn-helix transcriptional regulator [Kaistia sp. 32K]BCP53838.1 AraC family transcriptional regulator [Kaistia sp. 32K]
MAKALKQLKSAIAAYVPDRSRVPAVALHLDFADYEAEVPMHRHRKGQLVLAHHGAVTCTAAGGLWIVPPHCGVWIPGGIDHSNTATANARLSYLFVEPDAASLPGECCILAVTPLVRELIDRLAEFGDGYSEESHAGRLARILLDELTAMPQEPLRLPVSDHPKIEQLARMLTANPGDRSRLDEWAARLALSERSLSRLIEQETGLTFGRWRQRLHLLVALRELASGATVQRVSEALGYESVTAFITMFKKSVGETPARYFARLKSGP